MTTLLILTHLMAFLIGALTACRIIVKSADETFANPTGRWAKAMDFLTRHFGDQ